MSTQRSVALDTAAFLKTWLDLTAELAQCPPEVGKLGLRCLERLGDGGFFEQETLPAAAAGDLALLLRPSPALLAVLAAVRAGDVDFLRGE